MKKHPAKLFALIAMSIFSLLLIAACGGTGQSTSGSSDQASTPSGPAKDAIKIDQVPWTVESTVKDQERRLGIAFENKSEYPILSFKLTYSIDPEATLDDISPAFLGAEADNDFLVTKFKEVTEDDLKKLSIIGDIDILTEPGSTSEQSMVTIGSVYLTNDAQLEYFHPNMLTLEYLVGDKMYTETYDYQTESYSLSSDVKTVNAWPENELTAQLPAPEGLVIESARVENGELSFRSIGTSVAAFNAYVEECQSYGFNTDIERSEYVDDFEATNADTGYRLEMNLIYGSIDGTLKSAE